MAKKQAKPSLTPRQGKCLRFVVARTLADPEKVQNTGPIQPSVLLTKIEWSDLPQTILQAMATLDKLEALGLVERSEQGYTATQAGISEIQQANEAKLWNT